MFFLWLPVSDDFLECLMVEEVAAYGLRNPGRAAGSCELVLSLEPTARLLAAYIVNRSLTVKLVCVCVCVLLSLVTSAFPSRLYPESRAFKFIIYTQKRILE